MPSGHGVCQKVADRQAWQPPLAAAAGSSLPASTAADRAEWVSQKDLDAVNNKQRLAVAKAGFSDATTAALHG